MRWRCIGHFFGQASLLFSKLKGRGNGLVGRGSHVEKHFAQMGASGNAANVSVNGFAPTCTQFAANQFVHPLGCFVAFRVWFVSHVGEHIVNDELVVDRQANAQVMNGLTRFTGVLAWNDKTVGLDVGERGFNVPHAVFPLEA